MSAPIEFTFNRPVEALRHNVSMRDDDEYSRDTNAPRAPTSDMGVTTTPQRVPRCLPKSPCRPPSSLCKP